VDVELQPQQAVRSDATAIGLDQGAGDPLGVGGGDPHLAEDPRREGRRDLDRHADGGGCRLTSWRAYWRGFTPEQGRIVH
jgi:hypothetical protein